MNDFEDRNGINFRWEIKQFDHVWSSYLEGQQIEKSFPHEFYDLVYSSLEFKYVSVLTKIFFKNDVISSELNYIFNHYLTRKLHKISPEYYETVWIDYLW